MAFINYELWRDVSIHNCIQHALDDLEKLEWTSEMKDELRLMRSLYVCGRKWGKGAQFEAALSSFGSIIFQHSLQLQVFCLEVSVKDLDSDFLATKRRAIEGDMEKLHQILSNESSLATCIEMEDLLVIIDSLLHLSELKHKDLKESIRLLKNLIGFVRLRGFEPQQMGDLFFFKCLKVLDYFHPYKIVEIKPLESQVCEIYVGVLQKALGLPDSSSNSVLDLGSQTSLLADFVDSLLYLLLQLIFRHSPGRVYLHHMYKLYQGLRFLRTSPVAEQHDKIDELHRKRYDLICEVGVIVCYLFNVEEEANLDEKLVQHFLSFEEKFKLLKPEEEVPRYQLPSECPQTNLLGFIDSLLINLSYANLYEAADFLSESTMNKLNIIHDDLEYLRSFLADVMGKEDQNRQLQVLWTCVATVAYETEFVLDSLLVGDTRQSLLVSLGTITSEIERIKTETLGISNRMGQQFIEFQRTTKIDSKKPLTGNIPKFDEAIVGLDDESKKIIERLKRGSNNFDIVFIVGMAGLGKTTLARKVYRDPPITFHFNVHLWCTVSQGRDNKSLLLEILNSIGKKSNDELSKMNEYELGDELRRYLKGKRYLIILDDVWDVEVWSGLRISFPCDGKGSRILVITRSEKVCSQIKPDSESHHLHFLNNDESWELFRTKVCFEEDCPLELRARGESISTFCKGLPLMIVVVAGILSNMEPCKWEEIEKRIKKGNLPTTDECEKIVELSYHHLPNYLKPCFLYFGVYKEDEIVRVRELLWLWIAEGFVKKTENEHKVEDVAMGYMTELIQRNLIMVAERGSLGQVTSCILHDVSLDFCKKKGKQEYFLHSLQ